MKKLKLNRVSDRQPRVLAADQLAKANGGIIIPPSTVQETINKLLDLLGL